MDTPATTEDRGRIAGAGAGRAEEAVMWWIIGFVVLCTVISVVIARRGPGDGADHSGDPGRRDPFGHVQGSGGGGFDGGGGGM